MAKASNQVWVAKNQRRKSGDLIKRVEVRIKHTIVNWLNKCFVGILVKDASMIAIREVFFLNGFFSIHVRPMGNNLALLSGNKEDDLKELLQNNKEGLVMRILKLAKYRLKAQVEKNEGLSGEGQSPQVEKDEGSSGEG